MSTPIWLLVVKTVLGSHFGVGEFTAHFRTYSSGDWDVHRGYGILTPWPFPRRELSPTYPKVYDPLPAPPPPFALVSPKTRPEYDALPRSALCPPSVCGSQLSVVLPLV